MGYRKILFPLDGTEHSERALPLAIECARRSGAELIILSVVPDVESGQSAIDLTDQSESFAGSELGVMRIEYLQNLRNMLQDRVSSFRILFSGGDPAERVLATGTDCEVDLIVMGTHGRSGLARGFLGSVADAVISMATIPILAVRGNTAPQARNPRFDTIHVALDGSELAEASIDAASLLAGEFGTRLNLVRVVPDAPPGIESSQAQIYLEQRRDLLKKQGIEAQITLLRGSPSKELLTLGESGADSVIAITTNGRGGLSRAIRGSVADHLIRESSIPILVRSPEAVTTLGSSIH